jgi:REP element-mobilizing transposase RayT
MIRDDVPCDPIRRVLTPAGGGDGGDLRAIRRSEDSPARIGRTARVGSGWVAKKERQRMDGWPIAYHITFSTHGSRLHGDPRGTVDRRHNQPGEPFLDADPRRSSRERSRMRTAPVVLTRDQRTFIEDACPGICERGGWTYHVAAAGPDHVHVLLSAAAEGKGVRRILKRWLTEALSSRWRIPATGWWTECGSVKWIWKRERFNHTLDYIGRQRTDVLHPHRAQDNPSRQS